MKTKRLLLALIAALALPAAATTTNVIDVDLINLTSSGVTNRNVQLTLLNQPRIEGNSLVIREPVARKSGTNNIASFTNCVWGTYRIDIAGTPASSFTIWLSTNNAASSNRFYASTLVTNAAGANFTNWYTADQVDTLLAALPELSDVTNSAWWLNTNGAMSFTGNGAGLTNIPGAITAGVSNQWRMDATNAALYAAVLGFDTNTVIVAGSGGGLLDSTYYWSSSKGSWTNAGSTSVTNVGTYAAVRYSGNIVVTNPLGVIGVYYYTAGQGAFGNATFAAYKAGEAYALKVDATNAASSAATAATNGTVAAAAIASTLTSSGWLVVTNVANSVTNDLRAEAVRGSLTNSTTGNADTATTATTLTSSGWGTVTNVAEVTATNAITNNTLSTNQVVRTTNGYAAGLVFQTTPVGPGSGLTNMTPGNDVLFSLDQSRFSIAADGVNCSGVSVATGSTALFTTNAYFAAGDVGKVICVRKCGAQTNDFTTTIAAYVGPTNVTLTTAVSQGITNGAADFGTDDTAAFQYALDQVTNGNLEIVLHGNIIINGAPQGTNNAQLVVPPIWVPAQAGTTNKAITTRVLRLRGTFGNQITEATTVDYYHPNTHRGAATIISTCTNLGTLNPTNMASVIDACSYTTPIFKFEVPKKHVFFNDIRVEVERVAFRSCYDNNGTTLNLSGANTCRVKDVRIDSGIHLYNPRARGSRYEPVYHNTNTWGLMISPCFSAGNSQVENVQIIGFANGMNQGEHATISQAEIFTCTWAINGSTEGAAGGGHRSAWVNCDIEDCGALWKNDTVPNGVSMFATAIEDNAITNMIGLWDPNNGLFGHIHFNRPTNPMTNNGAAWVNMMDSGTYQQYPTNDFLYSKRIITSNMFNSYYVLNTNKLNTSLPIFDFKQGSETFLNLLWSRYDPTPGSFWEVRILRNETYGMCSPYGIMVSPRGAMGVLVTGMAFNTNGTFGVISNVVSGGFLISTNGLIVHSNSWLNIPAALPEGAVWIGSSNGVLSSVKMLGGARTTNHITLE